MQKPEPPRESRTEPEPEAKVVKKLLTTKQQNSYQRKQQILTYKSLVAKEERQRRLESRQQDEPEVYELLSSPTTSPDQSPRKRKRVSFDPRDVIEKREDKIRKDKER